jgi:Ca-activated chloride channel family protein
VLLGVVLVLATVAIAGPAWVREPAPFADDSAALVIAVEVTPTMLAQDVQPSRLERAAQKIRDLLARRKGAATALVAYAGSAHLVMPLTEDGDLIADFAAELSPEIMPAEGDAADEAVELASQQLTASGRAGSVLLVTDGLTPGAAVRIGKQRQGGATRVHVFGVGAGADAVVPPGSPPAPPLDRRALAAAADAGDGDLVLVTPDGSDADRLAGIVETEFTAADDPEGGDRWRDAGYWLLPLLVLLALLWFRPGWVVTHD